MAINGGLPNGQAVTVKPQFPAIMSRLKSDGFEQGYIQSVFFLDALASLGVTLSISQQ